MSESEIQKRINAEEAARDDPPAEVIADDGFGENPVDKTAAVKTPEPDDTVGTGSAIALGCIAGTVVLIAIGLIVILVSLALT